MKYTIFEVITQKGLTEEQAKKQEEDFRNIYLIAINTIEDPALQDILADYVSSVPIYIGEGWLKEIKANRFPTVKHGSLYYSKDKLVSDKDTFGNTVDFLHNILHELIFCKVSNKPMRLEILRQELQMGIEELLFKGKGIPEIVKRRWFDDYLKQNPPSYFFSRAQIIRTRWILRKQLKMTTNEAVAFCHWTETAPTLTGIKGSTQMFKDSRLNNFYRKIVRSYIISYLKL